MKPTPPPTNNGIIASNPPFLFIIKSPPAIPAKAKNAFRMARAKNQVQTVALENVDFDQAGSWGIYSIRSRLFSHIPLEVWPLGKTAAAVEIVTGAIVTGALATDVL